MSKAYKDKAKIEAGPRGLPPGQNPACRSLSTGSAAPRGEAPDLPTGGGYARTGARSVREEGGGPGSSPGPASEPGSSMGRGGVEGRSLRPGKLASAENQATQTGEAERATEVKVYFRNFGSLFEAIIIPIEKLPYSPPPQYEYETPDGEIRKIVKPVWLCAKAKQDVRECLMRQGLNPSDFITPATVHGKWKIQLHQGIVYAKKLLDITSEANPGKPIPSHGEIDTLFYSKLEKLLGEAEKE